MFREAPLSVPVITLGRLPDTIQYQDLTPCDRLLYAMEAVAALTAGSHAFERYRGKLTTRRNNGKINLGHMQEHWSPSSLMNVKGMDKNDSSAEFKKLLASNTIWHSLNQDKIIPSGKKITPEEGLIRERNRIFLLFTAKFFDKGMKLYSSKKYRNNGLFKDFNKKQLRDFLRKCIHIFLKHGAAEITRCKSWQLINYRYAREPMFDWYCIGWLHSQPLVAKKIGGKTGGKASLIDLFDHLQGIILNEIEKNSKLSKEGKLDILHRKIAFKRIKSSAKEAINLEIEERKDETLRRILSENHALQIVLASLFCSNAPDRQKLSITRILSKKSASIQDLIILLNDNFVDVCEKSSCILSGIKNKKKDNFDKSDNKQDKIFLLFPKILEKPTSNQIEPQETSRLSSR